MVLENGLITASEILRPAQNLNVAMVQNVLFFG